MVPDKQKRPDFSGRLKYVVSLRTGFPISEDE